MSLLQVNHQQHQHGINISNVNKIHTNKYIEHDPSKPPTTSTWDKSKCKKRQQYKH